MAVVNGQGMKYRVDLDNWSVYGLYVDNRCVLEASVNNDDPELCIWVGKPGATAHDVCGEENDAGSLLKTGGHAIKGIHEVGGTSTSPGDLKDHIDGLSVQQYVLTRVVRLLADVYVPRAGTVAGEIAKS